MNIRLIALSLTAACVAAPTLASDYASGEVGYIPPVTVAESTLTRAEVQEQLLAQPPAPPAEEPRAITREEVRAELMQALRDGQMPVNGEGADIGARSGTRMVHAAQPAALAAR